MPVDAPGAAPRPPAQAAGPVKRIGLLLPMQSESLGAAAEAVRAGFMAAYERDRQGFEVNLIATGEDADDALDAYMGSAKQHDIMVGPLARSAVTAIAVSGAVSVPTIALNHPENSSTQRALPLNMMAIGLSIEDQARQVAQWAAAEHPKSNALIVSGTNPWQRRLAAAFAARWKALGNPSELVEMSSASGFLTEAELAALRTKVETTPPTLLFAALDAPQLRQVRSNLGTALPLYGTSSVNPGNNPAMANGELDGVRMLDMPWQVQPDHTAVMSYPRRSASARVADLDRLYALGIDAFRIARELALRPNTAFEMDGVTGRLSVRLGGGPTRFERKETPAVFQGGTYRLLERRP